MRTPTRIASCASTLRSVASLRSSCADATTTCSTPRISRTLCITASRTCAPPSSRPPLPPVDRCRRCQRKHLARRILAVDRLVLVPRRPRLLIAHLEIGDPLRKPVRAHGVIVAPDRRLPLADLIARYLAAMDHLFFPALG